MITRIATILCVLFLFLAVQAPARAEGPKPALKWHTDYGEAMRLAKRQRKMMFVVFQGRRRDRLRRQFERQTLADEGVQGKFAKYFLVKLPTSATISVEGKQVSLLKHDSFAEMYGRQGIAILDMTDEKSEQFQKVVSEFPFGRRFRYGVKELSVILDLPPGSLTQRTLIYAVRMHPDAPESTDGKIHQVLLKEAQSHSAHQASIQTQGHHNWEGRFHRINARLPGGLVSREVCAESWPGEELVEAAVECVNSWRQSDGHWRAVRSRQRLFGYDMKRGGNRIWYATGIFGSR